MGPIVDGVEVGNDVVGTDVMVGESVPNFVGTMVMVGDVVKVGALERDDA